ncbi:hypothetical protein FRZ67_18760 [Panacibacter ginsenosidivorans]|uniref:Heavy metal binding domain-containing protein n=1 Tax=Panacibacter ginsenosidivorans TaxID=1813871 RepID=A0A5B8VCQ0_9BACT|nr:heavy metal-binding domain-containing protein [Panacibacter ginsenosidivorans]QEC69250.1 hypothetical protein FRZ67_18760 [Panacibacter ginsenosidivorans]
MKQTIIASMLFAASVFAACNSSSSSDSKKDTMATTPASDTSKMISAVKYTCTMHPEVISDTAGKCPKCGMEMVPIKDSSMQKMDMDTMKH